MVPKNFEILRKLLRPLSEAEVAAVVRATTEGSKGEQLSLADADLEDEVRELFEPRAKDSSTGHGGLSRDAALPAPFRTPSGEQTDTSAPGPQG